MKRDRLWLVPLVFMLQGLFFGLADYPLLDPDEGRNAEVAREMAANNQYLVPHLNELPYVDKPVLFFGVAAVSMEIFGPTVFAARLAPLLFTLLTIGLVWWFGKRLYGQIGGWIAALATGTMPLTLAFARTVIFDSALTFFVTASLVSFYIAVETKPDEEGKHEAQRWIPAAFGFIALGVLTKGPIAIILPLLVAVPYSLWRRRAKLLLDPMGWLLLVAIVLPWVAIMSREVPDFVRYVVYTESVGRLFTDELQRTGPFWYFIPIFFSGALPWSLVVLSSLRQLTRDKKAVFCLLWILLPLVFFSLSQSKRPQYVVPLMPPIGLLVAHLWTTKRDQLPGVKATAFALFPIAVILGAASAIVDGLLDVSPSIADAIPATALILALSTGAAAVGLILWSRKLVVVMSLLCLPAAAIAFASPRLMDAIGEDRSSYRAAIAIAPLIRETTEIVTVDTYPLSLPFYLRRTFTLSTTDGSELTSNYLIRSLDQFRGRPDSPVKPADWWLDAITNCTRPRIFVVARDNQRANTILSDRLPLIVEMKRALVYGPCSTTALASNHRD